MFEGLFDELQDGLCVTDAHGRLLYMNSSAERLLDVPFARASGKTLCELLCGHLAVDGASECASTCELQKPASAAGAVTFRGNYGPKEIATWKDFKVQRRSVWKNLRVRCLKSSSSLLGEGRHTAFIEDVSADAEHERQKEEWRQMIAHDLRSPLTSIYATIRIFQDAAGGPPPDGSGTLVDAAERSCRKMLELITLYLDVAKLDAGVAEVRRAAVRLADAVKAEISEQDATARGKSLEIVWTEPEPIVVEADEELLSRVVQNLLDNAVKFTPFGGRIEIAASSGEGEAVLTFKDGGPGVAPEELDHLFDRFHQARARRAGKIQGTGLGLTFCLEALKIMGGSIAAASKPGEGAEFTVRLPLAAHPKPAR
ncbi:MAG TPA: PAS domain-containing sensor histidine kinase [Elusimicrobiota bacterium]|jgi:signal transduction histidine kinase|nr:PAS domain-containing sensor histidine kinase [Elusimicrobiota bacterium]